MYDVSLNPYEFLMDDDNNLLTFHSKEEAIKKFNSMINENLTENEIYKTMGVEFLTFDELSEMGYQVSLSDIDGNK